MALHEDSRPNEAPLPDEDATGDVLRMLLVEDSEDDALLLLHELRRGGFQVQSTRVETPSEMLRELRDGHWNLVISDYRLPSMDGLAALRILQETGLDLPFIIVSGTIGEDVAVEVMRAGAHDYVMKDNLARLGAAIRRELKEADDRRTRRRLEEGYRNLVENSLQGLIIIQDGVFAFANPASAEILGRSPAELVALTSEEALALIHPDDRGFVTRRYEDCLSGRGGAPRFEVRLLRASGEVRWVEAFTSRIDFAGQPALQSAVVDITQRTQREREQKAIAKLATALRAARTRSEMPPVILDQILDLLQAEGAALVTREPTTGDIVYELTAGVWTDLIPARVDRPSLSAEVFATGQPFLSNQAHREPRLAFPEIAHKTRSIAGIPLIAEDLVVGILWIGRSTVIEPSDMRVLTAIAEMAASAMRRVSLHEETLLRMRRLDALRSVDLAITTSRDLDMVFGVLVDQVAAQLQVDAVSVLRYESGTDTLASAAALGLGELAVSSSQDRLGDGLAGSAALELHGIEVANLDTLSDPSSRDTALLDAGFVSYWGLPLIANDELKGVIEVLTREPIEVDAEWQGFLQTVAWQAAIAIDSATLVEELQRSNLELAEAYETTLEGWARALELRDEETVGHTRRVVDLTIRMARMLGITDGELTHVRRGALLHDIGKMAIPDSILLKPGPLDNDERLVIRQHPDHAFELLSPIAHLRAAIDIPYCHHERWDGTGYPRGLNGDEIPLAARIFAVVDVWDALRSDRPYRSAWPEDKVLAYIRDQSGQHFDPQVVDSFLATLDAAGE